MNRVFWVLVGIAVIMFTVGTIGKALWTDRLMRECQADGKKEYECYSLIHNKRD